MLGIIHLVAIRTGTGPPGTADIRRVTVHQLITTEGIGAEEGERITHQHPVAQSAYQEVCSIVRNLCAAGCGMPAMVQAGTYLLHRARVEVETDREVRRALVEQDCPMPQEGLNVHRMGGASG
jgi:uncharacterized membrane protein YciS (DUF1049 family)